MSYPLPSRDLPAFLASCEVSLRRPIVEWGGSAPVAVFLPDLDATEQATYLRLTRLHRSRLGLTPGEFDALGADLVTLRAYMQAATPTAAQTVTATKSIIRVLRAILD